MDPALLAALPDAAKLGILRHLGQAAAPPGQPIAGLPGAEAPAASNGRGGDADAGATPPLLAGRRMTEGLAIVDGFLTTGEVQVRLQG